MRVVETVLICFTFVSEVVAVVLFGREIRAAGVALIETLAVLANKPLTRALSMGSGFIDVWASQAFEKEEGVDVRASANADLRNECAWRGDGEAGRATSAGQSRNDHSLGVQEDRCRESSGRGRCQPDTREHGRAGGPSTSPDRSRRSRQIRFSKIWSDHERACRASTTASLAVERWKRESAVALLHTTVPPEARVLLPERKSPKGERIAISRRALEHLHNGLHLQPRST